jgi:hypothetical protein
MDLTHFQNVSFDSGYGPDLLHGIRAGSLNDDGHFPLDVEHVFG